MSNKCPICEKDVSHLNNHVRMSNDDQHGDQGRYPENWDNETRTIIDELEDAVDELEENVDDLEAAELEDDSDSNTNPDDLLEDDPDDATTYNCGECGHELEYLGGDDREEGGKECPECGERLYWSMVQ